MATKTTKKEKVGKKDLAKKLADKCGLKQNKSLEVVNEIFAMIPELVKSEGEVSLYGFGTFTLSTTPARTLKSKLAGDKIINIPEKKCMRFKSYRATKDMMNS